jgi:glycosyltransferase involved in cell wall biosynthesis
MKIIVDLRCLNYSPITGVNAYCIRFLHCLFLNKLSNSSWQIFGLGLKQKRKEELCKKFVFFDQLFDEYITISQYNNSPIHNGKINEIKTLVRIYTQKNINSSKVQFYDYLILPQPRPIFKNPKTKLITVVHDVFSILDNSNNWSQKIIYSRITVDKILQSSHKVIVNSITTSQDVQKYFPQSGSINLVYPSLPKLTQLFRDNNQSKASQSQKLPSLSQDFILALSGIEKRKNWLNLIRAYKLLIQTGSKTFPEVPHLVLAGTIVDKAYYRQILKLIQELNLKSIIWILNPTEEEKEFLLKKCKLLVYPSIYEGFGFPILEALQFGTKVLTSCVSSMPEVGKASCSYINPFNPIDIYLGIEQSLQSKATNSAYKNEFSWKELQMWLSNNII